MAPRRVTPILIFSLLLGAMPLLTMNLESSLQTTASAPVPSVSLRRPPQNRLVPTKPAAALAGPNCGRPATLSRESASLLVDELALRQLAHNTDLQLTDQQWTDLAIVASYYQAVRQAHEAGVAEVSCVGQRRFRLHVAPYPEVGDALRDDFFAAVRGHLGADAAERVVRQIGHALEGYFGGFGISAQTLEFVAESRHGAPDYLVTRTITFWNRVANEDRLSTRSEFHVPSAEDPTGRTWGPFLSLLNNYEREQAEG